MKPSRPSPSPAFVSRVRPNLAGVPCEICSSNGHNFETCPVRRKVLAKDRVPERVPSVVLA